LILLILNLLYKFYLFIPIISFTLPKIIKKLPKLADIYNKDKENIMAICPHLFVTYVGIQKTLTEGKFLKLYQCLNCGSTITLSNNPKSKIINPNKNIENIPLQK